MFIFTYLLYIFCRRDALPRENVLNLAFFLGEQLRNLHLLPYPSMTTSTFSDIKQEINLASTNRLVESDSHQMCMPAEWEFFIKTLIRRKKDVLSRLTKWYAHVITLFLF